ncbi:MAG: hypothetical protein ACLUD2_03625 [Clostridium sp.]
MMAGLEEELGVQLFARIKRGVILTDNGARLIPYIQEMVNQKDKLRQAAFNINHKIEGKLRVGSFSSITALWMPDVIHFSRNIIPVWKLRFWMETITRSGNGSCTDRLTVAFSPRSWPMT